MSRERALVTAKSARITRAELANRETLFFRSFGDFVQHLVEITARE
jgi:hypothetical protein